MMIMDTEFCISFLDNRVISDAVSKHIPYTEAPCVYIFVYHTDVSFSFACFLSHEVQCPF